MEMRNGWKILCYIRKKYKENELKIIVFVLILVGIFLPKIIDFLFVNKLPFLISLSTIKSSDVLQFLGSIISAVGTIALGIVTIRQAKFANEINARLMELENNKTRPYLRISNDDFILAISKENFEFTEEFKWPVEDNSLRYEGISRHLCKKGIEDIDCMFPEVAVIKFNIKNIGNFPIASLTIKKFVVYSGDIGEVDITKRGYDTDLMVNECKQVYIRVIGKMLQTRYDCS